MAQRRMMLIVILGLLPLLLAMRPVDEELFNAGKTGDQRKAENVLKQGADVNAVNEDGMTPLLIAAKNRHRDVIALLVDKGADVNGVIPYGVTPLTLTTALGDRGIVALWVLLSCLVVWMMSGVPAIAESGHGFG